MANRTLPIIAAVAVVALLALLYLGTRPDETPPAAPETPAVAEAPPPLPERPVEAAPPPAPPQEPEAAPPPVEVEPEPEQVAEAPPPAEPGAPQPDPLPPLDRSDDYVLERIAGLERGNEVLRLLVDDQVVRRFVVFVENISRGVVPQQDSPIRPVRTPLQVRELGENNYVLETASFERFTGMLDTLLTVDTDRAMEIYMGIKPLLQDAYAEIGFPGRDFNQLLARAIDRVLEAEVPEGPYLLNRPSVMYRFADEELEAMSAVQKLLVRLGPENTERLRAKLREFRTRLPQ